MSQRRPSPHRADRLADVRFDIDTVRTQWPRLHALDAEPLPDCEAVLAAWALFHSGAFEQAEAAGLRAGAAGMAVANRAASAYATLLEPRENVRMALYQQIAARARAQATEHPQEASAWYWHGRTLARYAQGVRMARALAQGIGTQLRGALEATLALAPRHAFAHAALGGFHAQVIEQVGPLIGAMSYGVSAERARWHLREAERLAPDSAAVLMEHAAALLMLDGAARLGEATRLQEQAAEIHPRDAAERLWVELARASLAL